MKLLLFNTKQFLGQNLNNGYFEIFINDGGYGKILIFSHLHA